MYTKIHSVLMLLATAGLCTQAAPSSASSIYKYTNAAGVVTYSNTPVTAIKPTTKTATAKTTATTTAPAVKWHPGHYVLVYASTTDSQMPSIINSLNYWFLGIQRRYNWNTLEPTQGKYNFSSIKNDLASLALVGKRLIVTVEAETFNQPGVAVVPTYLLSSTYGGGVYATTSGTNANYWNTAVQDRLVALYQAMGSQLDAYSNLEAITTEETAPSAADSSWNSIYLTDHINGMTRVVLAAKAAFPHTVVMQYMNYPVTTIPTMLSTLESAGVGTGGPDVFTADPGLASGSYPYIKGAANIAPIGMAVQYEDYSTYMHGGPYSPPGIAALYQYAQSQLKANYIFWLRRTAEDATAANGYHASNYFQDVINFLSPMNWAADPAGGLSTACPTTLIKCVN